MTVVLPGRIVLGFLHVFASFSCRKGGVHRYHSAVFEDNEGWSSGGAPCSLPPGVQYMVKSVSKGYIMEQGLQKKIIEDWVTVFFNLDPGWVPDSGT